MKQTMRIMLALVLVLALSSTAWAYTDTAGLSSGQQTAITYLSDLGVVSGYEDDTFRPAHTVTQGEFIKMLCVFRGFGELPEVGHPWGIPEDAWYYAWVAQAWEQGWLAVDGEVNFRPSSTISQSAALRILLRVAGEHEVANTYGGEGAEEAFYQALQEQGLTEGFTYSAEEVATRAVAAQMLYNLVPEEDKPILTGQLRGIVQSVTETAFSLKDGRGVVSHFTAQPFQTAALVPGAYLELTANNGRAVSIDRTVLAARELAYWDFARDGRSVTIGDVTYDITEAEFYAASYGINQGYTAESFLKGGPANPAVVTIGGTMGAEMAVVVEAEGDKLLVAYLVNGTVNIGTRIDVVGSLSEEDGQPQISWLGRQGSFPVDAELDITELYEGQLIHYTIGDVGMSRYELLLDPVEQVLAYPENGFGEDQDDPAGWLAGASGRLYTGERYADIICTLLEYDEAAGTVRLGSTNRNQRYPLIEGCPVYAFEVESGQVSAALRDDLAEAEQVLALQSKGGEILLLLILE